MIDPVEQLRENLIEMTGQNPGIKEYKTAFGTGYIVDGISVIYSRRDAKESWIITNGNKEIEVPLKNEHGYANDFAYYALVGVFARAGKYHPYNPF